MWRTAYRPIRAAKNRLRPDSVYPLPVSRLTMLLRASTMILRSSASVGLGLRNLPLGSRSLRMLANLDAASCGLLLTGERDSHCLTVSESFLTSACLAAALALAAALPVPFADDLTVNALAGGSGGVEARTLTRQPR